MSAVLLITSVLPMIPISVKPFLEDILDIFSRLAKFHVLKPGNKMVNQLIFSLKFNGFNVFSERS